MTMPESENVTQLLIAWGQGDEAARDELIPLVYGTLRRIGASIVQSARADQPDDRLFPPTRRQVSF
jgi:hypothetical protein